MEDKKTNAMGSDIKNGYKCKPERSDPNKPIMYYKIHLFICDGERCSTAYENDYADRVRGVIKSMGLDKGVDRIKVTRSQCFGACRFRGVAVIYRNGNSRDARSDGAVWMKKIDTFSVEEWEKLFTKMKENIPIDEIIPDENKINMKLYD